MQPQILTDSQNGNPLSTGSEDGGWKRVETSGDGIGPGKSDAIPKSVSGLPRPRILTQRKKYANTTPINLKRKEMGRIQYQEVANPSAYVGMGQPNSQGVGQYFYAPNDGNLGKDVATRAGLLLADGGRGGNGGGLVTGPVDSRGQWSDSDMVVELGQDGYPRYDGDSNFARRPKTWRFRTKDRDVSMFPQNNQTNSPEAPSQFDIGNESLFYPIQGAVVMAAEGEGHLGYRFGNPDIISEETPGEALVQVPVWAVDNQGTAYGDEPYFDIRFWMYADKKSKGKAYLNTNLGADVYEYPAGKNVLVKSNPINLNDNKTAKKLVQSIPVNVLTEAATAMGLEYQGAESKAEEHRQAVSELDTMMGTFFPPDKIESIGQAVDKMKKGEADNYLRGLGRDLVHAAGAQIPGATAEDVAKFLREALAKRKAEQPEPEPEKWASPDFRSVAVADLGKYMYKDHRAAYEKLPESEQAQVLKIVRDALGDSGAANYTEEQVKDTVGEAVAAATVKIKPDTEKEKEKEEPEEQKNLPKDMLPQETLFRDVEGWQDDYQTYSGDDLDESTRKVLEQNPEGEGNYFKWQYVKPDKEKKTDAVLVIIRKPAWKTIQGDI